MKTYFNNIDRFKQTFNKSYSEHDLSTRLYEGNYNVITKLIDVQFNIKHV